MAALPRAVAVVVLCSVLVACSDSATDSGRVAEAEITCAVEAGDRFCENRRDDVVAEHCGQDEVSAVRLTVYRSQLQVTGEVGTVLGRESHTEVVSRETKEYPC